MSFLLPYTPPYHWPAMLDFLAARAVPATEQVVDGCYRRSLRIAATVKDATANPRGSLSGKPPGASAGAPAGHPAGRSVNWLTGTVTVTHEPQRHALRVELSAGLEGAETEALERLGRMFDVGSDPAAIGSVLGELAVAHPGLRLPGAVDPFEVLVRAILGQQISVPAARTLAARLVDRFGTPLTGHEPGPTHLFPLAATIAGADPARLGEIGIIRTRSQAIVAAAEAIAGGTLQLVAGAAVEPSLAALDAIRGIGPWTAHYVAMRALGWADAFPPGDVVVLKALGVATPSAAADLARRWRPWRAYAVLHLWRGSALSARLRSGSN